MLTLDSTLLQEVITAAKAAAADYPRWISAIERAGRELEGNPWIEVQGSHLLIASTSGAIYDVNGRCQCAAYKNGQACWHRAARQLVARYEEAQNEAPTTQHIAIQAKAAYAAANGPSRPLFAERDAETMRQQALGEERAVLLEQQRIRKLAAARATELLNETFA